MKLKSVVHKIVEKFVYFLFILFRKDIFGLKIGRQTIVSIAWMLDKLVIVPKWKQWLVTVKRMSFMWDIRYCRIVSSLWNALANLRRKLSLEQQKTSFFFIQFIF